jgi:DNA invertase Pin-like site-specific DNA recombinase
LLESVLTGKHSTHKPPNSPQPGAAKMFREKVSGAKSDCAQLIKALGALSERDGLLVIITRLGRLARSSRDLLEILAAIAEKVAGFRSLGDGWADTKAPHTVLGGLAEFERELIRARTRKGRARAVKERGWSSVANQNSLPIKSARLSGGGTSRAKA